MFARAAPSPAPAGRQRDDVFDRLAVVGKAFASANRLKIIDLLAQRERSVESMARELGVAVTTVSAHLQILKMANVVATRSAGTRARGRHARVGLRPRLFDHRPVPVLTTPERPLPYATPSQDIPVGTAPGTPPQDPPGRTAGSTEPTITDSVVTEFAGMALGGTVLWFLAPICFNC